MNAVEHTMPPGTLVAGPQAVGGDFRRLLVLTRTLAVMEFKLRFFGSALGYLWQLARPLMLFGVLYLIFSEFVRFNEGVKHFPVILLMGIVLFTFFADATTQSVRSVVERENLVRKVQFPRLAVPLSVVLTAGFNLVLNVCVVFVFALISGVEPQTTWLLVPVVLAALVVLTTGIATLLSALYMRFRDVEPIWEVFAQLLFYASPILYAIEVIDNPEVRKYLLFSPVAALIQQMRHWAIDPAAPSAKMVLGGWGPLMIPLGIIVVAFVLGLWVFSREAPRVAEEL
jgi:ABC-2 type transport system permease protein